MCTSCSACSLCVYLVHSWNFQYSPLPLDFGLSVSGFVHVDLTFVVLYLHSWPFDDTNPAQKCKRIPAKHFKVTLLGTIEVL